MLTYLIPSLLGGGGFRRCRD